MTDKTTAPTGVVSSPELGLLREWAAASGTRFVCRSHGLQTTNTVSHDDLLQLVQAAVVAERERLANHFDSIADKCSVFDLRIAYRKTADVIRSKQPNPKASG